MSKTSKIFLILLGLIYSIYGAFMLGSYFEIVSSFYLPWHEHLAIATWYKRSFGEFLFLIVFSYLCFLVVLRKPKNRIIWQFFLICIGLFAFFLSGQNVKVYLTKPGVEVCFGTIPYRTVYHPPYGMPEIMNTFMPEYEFKENFFSFYIKVKNDPAKKEGAYILSGIGPILRLKNR